MGSDARNNPFSRWKNADQVVQTEAYDRHGRQLQPGDVVHIIGKGDIMWRVQGVKPILAPDAPKGLVEISLIAVFMTGVPGGTPIADLLKVKDASEFPVTITEPGDGLTQ